MPTLFQRIGRALNLVEPESPVQDESQPKQITLHVEGIGSSGIENYSGYYSEEYLSKLRGTQAADIWDQMRRSDPKIKMVLMAVKNPIKGAHWSVQPGEQTDEAKKHAELIEQILFKDLDQSWTKQLAEILTMLDFGFSLFEVVHKVVTNHPKFGNYVSLSKLAWRSPRTIERWNLDRKTGKILSVDQYAYGDLQRTVQIPGEFLLVFSHDKEGDNYEGVSALRACYGPWSRKNLYLKLQAVGMEKFAIPTPYMEVPEGKEGSQEFANAKLVLEKYVAHQQQYITFPAGWKLGFAQSNFDAEKIRSSIDKENMEMAHAFLENFLELGQSGSGSYALSYDLSDFFLMGIEHIAKDICETINRGLIPELVKRNFGPQQYYPELHCAGITDKPGKEFAEVLKILIDGKVVTPDQKLEENIREKYSLPAADAVTSRQMEPSQAQPALVPQLAEKNVIKLAESPKTPKALITQRTDELKTFMQGMLADIGSGLVKSLMAKKKRATPSQYLSVTNQVTPAGSRDYTAELKDMLSEVAAASIQMAKKEVPGGTKIKLAGGLDSIKLADSFKLLPKSVQDQITAQIGLLSTFQINDLMKALFFQFNSSVTSTDSDDLLEADLNDTLEKYLEGASVSAGAGNTVSKLVNESRSAFFFDEDVIDKVESFTFVNGDPVSPICQDLAGTVFSKDDPNMDRYSPPLHHNCKSYLVANLVGSGKEIDDGGLKPSKASLDKYITLADASTAIISGAFALAYVDVSKKVAITLEDAKRLLAEVTAVPPDQQSIEMETGYRFPLKDTSSFQDGTLRSFEPIEGVQVYYGKLKVD